jgi:Mn-dependent DtxR family transcriptional regulator
MVLTLQGRKDKILRLIFHTSIGWKSLFHIYRLSRKGEGIIHAKILSDELGHNVSNVRKVLLEMEDIGLITKTKLQKSEVVFISKIKLTPLGEEIASNIFNIVKCVVKSEGEIIKEKEVTEDVNARY